MEDAKHIHVKAAQVLGLGDVDRGLVLVAGAGVVDEDVELAEFLEGACHGSVPGLAFGHVHLLDDDGAGVFGGYGVCAGGVDVADEDFCSFADEELGDGGAKAGASSCEMICY